MSWPADPARSKWGPGASWIQGEAELGFGHDLLVSDLRGGLSTNMPYVELEKTASTKTPPRTRRGDSPRRRLGSRSGDPLGFEGALPPYRGQAHLYTSSSSMAPRRSSLCGRSILWAPSEVHRPPKGAMVAVLAPGGDPSGGRAFPRGGARARRAVARGA